MPHIGIDIFSLVVIGSAFIIAQIRQIPAQVRFGLMSAAFGVVAVDRLRQGAQGFNLIMVGLAIVFCINYAVRAVRYRSPPVN